MECNDKLLNKQDVLARLGFKTSTLYRLMRLGEFPQPIRIGPRIVRWPESEIEAYLADRPRATGEAA